MIISVKDLLESLSQDLENHVVILAGGYTWSAKEWKKYSMDREVKSMSSVPYLGTFLLVIEVNPGHGF